MPRIIERQRGLRAGLGVTMKNKRDNSKSSRGWLLGRHKDKADEVPATKCIINKTE